MLEDVPVGTGYLEGVATFSSLTGPLARVELGARPTERLGLFAFAQATADEFMAGMGARWRFGW